MGYYGYRLRHSDSAQTQGNYLRLHPMVDENTEAHDLFLMHNGIHCWVPID